MFLTGVFHALPQAKNCDGRPIWQPPIFDYSDMIREILGKEDKAVLKYYEEDIAKTTEYMDKMIEKDGPPFCALDLGLAERDDGIWLTMSLDDYRDLEDKKMAARWALGYSRHKNNTCSARGAEFDEKNEADSSEGEPTTSLPLSEVFSIDSQQSQHNQWGTLSLSPQWVQKTLNSCIKNEAKKVDLRPLPVRLMSLKRPEMAVKGADEATTNDEVD